MAVDLAQTVLLLVATFVAVKAYLGEQKARRHADVQARLERVATRIGDLGADAHRDPNVAGQYTYILMSKTRLRAALAAASGELPKAHALLDVGQEELRRDERVEEALREVYDELGRRTR